MAGPSRDGSESITSIWIIPITGPVIPAISEAIWPTSHRLFRDSIFDQIVLVLRIPNFQMIDPRIIPTTKINEGISIKALGIPPKTSAAKNVPKTKTNPNNFSITTPPVGILCISALII